MKKVFLLILFFILFRTITSNAASGIFDRYVIIDKGGVNYYSSSTFGNLNFGMLSSSDIFILKGGQLKTWKNGPDDITGATMYYRIYDISASLIPSFDTLNLPWKEDVQSPLGSIDQTWEAASFNLNMLNALSDGSYVIEIYFEAFYTDLNGDSSHIDDNSGNYYVAYFSVNNCILDLGPNITFCSAFNYTIQANSGHASYLWSTGATTLGIQVSQPGIYSVTVTNSGCTATDSVTIFSDTSVYSLNIGNDTTICGLGVVNLNAGAGFNSYLWSTGDTIAAVNVNTGGTYSITVSTDDDCLLMDECIVSFNSLPFVDLGTIQYLCLGDSIILDAGAGFSSYLWSDNSQYQQLIVYSQGVYSVTVTDANNCEGFDVVNVNILQNPIASFTHSQLQGLEVLFTDLSQNSTQNYWDFTGTGNYIPFNAGNVNHTYPFAGNYLVSLIASNSCDSDTTSGYVSVVSSLNEYEISNNIYLYPNPTTEKIFIENIPLETKKILVRNIHNYDVINDINFNEWGKLDVSKYPSGVYVLEFILSQKSYYKLFIKTN